MYTNNLYVSLQLFNRKEEIIISQFYVLMHNLI